MTVRTIPSALGPTLEALELDQPRLVTRSDVDVLRERTGTGSSSRYLIEQLVRNGWLLPLRTRGVWEFAPAARAGALSSGDRFIELRATLRKRPSLPVGVAAESAAWLQGLNARLPGRDAISAPKGLEMPPAVRVFRLVHRVPKLALDSRDGLPCWSTASLLAIMADRPSTYRDWPNVNDWIEEAVGRVEPSDLLAELDGRPRSGWARLAYLAARGGRDDLAATVMDAAPKRGKGPYYLGHRDRPGHHDGRFDVIDSALVRIGK